MAAPLPPGKSEPCPRKGVRRGVAGKEVRVQRATKQVLLIAAPSKTHSNPPVRARLPQFRQAVARACNLSSDIVGTGISIGQFTAFWGDWTVPSYSRLREGLQYVSAMLTARDAMQTRDKDARSLQKSSKHLGLSTCCALGCCCWRSQTSLARRIARVTE